MSQENTTTQTQCQTGLVPQQFTSGSGIVPASSNKFDDTKARIDVVSKLNKESSVTDIMNAVETLFPGWILLKGKAFVDEMELFGKQWDGTCKSLKIKDKQQILVVYKTFIEERMSAISRKVSLVETNHTCIFHLCDLLTSKGFFVRDDNAMSQCKMCKKICFANQFYSKYSMPGNGKCLKCNRRTTLGMKRIIYQQAMESQKAAKKAAKKQ